MSGITYADLIDGASTRIVTGAQAVRLRRFDDRDQARQALQDFHAVLDALEAHTWALIGPSRLAGISEATRAEPVVADAIGMVTGLRELVGGERPHPSVLALADRDWAQAALHVRGASDLLSVHLDRWGSPRSPDAALLVDPSYRDAALVRVAHQLEAVLSTEVALGLRCLQAGVTRAEVTRWLPGLAPNRAFARHLTSPARELPIGGELDQLQLIGEPIRTDDPVMHAADLIHRLRQSTWALRADPDYSVATLSDLATTGLAIHAHAAAAHGANLTRVPASIPDDAVPFADRAATWRELRIELAAYRAPGLAHPQIRADALTLRGLLADLAPLDGATPSDPRTPDLLRAAAHASQEIAATAGDVFRRLATSGHVHLHARLLAPGELGEDAGLITARLASATIPAPWVRWQATTDLWQGAAGRANPRFTPIEQSLTAALRTDQAHVLTHQPLERSPR